MNRKSLLIVVALVVVMVVWPAIDSKFIRPYFFPESENQAVPPVAASTNVITTAGNVASSTNPPAAAPFVARQSLAVKDFDLPLAQGQIVSLTNAHLQIDITSAGAGINQAILKDYPENDQPNSGPVILDFQKSPALVYHGSVSQTIFQVSTTSNGAVVLSGKMGNQGQLVRRYQLTGDYLLTIDDELTNHGKTDLVLTNLGLQVGHMMSLSGPNMSGVVDLGVDALVTANDKVVNWGDKLAGFFKAEQKALGRLPVEIVHRVYSNSVDWIAVKSQYFVQILTPQGGGNGCVVYAQRRLAPEELTNPLAKVGMQPLVDVAARIDLEDIALKPGDKLMRRMTYYVGPAKYTDLSKLGLRQVDVMELGMWAPISKILLQALDAIYVWVWPHNYGLAIIIVTMLIRILFWPITHKSTESMKRMQALQPQIKLINEKYKDNAQKKQQELMALYKANKINPVSGCLPLLIQIPVFIALYMVLRSAIELRYASFLWVTDLSRPENLFADVLPLPLNILPLIMAATMVWQQRLTPSGDPQQQKIMQFMPLMMLIFFYTMPAGLVLYWTTNQCLMIGQMLIGRRHKAKKK